MAASGAAVSAPAFAIGGFAVTDEDVTYAGVSAFIALLVSAYGFSKRSLNGSGAVAAFGVGFITFFSSYVFGLVLIVFFLSSSRITKVRAKEKQKLEDGHKEGGQRNAIQALCNSLPALVFGALYYRSFGHTLQPLWTGGDRGSAAAWATFCQVGVLAHYACCAGDTWASELGILDAGECRLATNPCRRVPRGTNGGLSLWGTCASLVGGVFIGVCFVWLNAFPGAHPDVALPAGVKAAAGGAVTQWDQWVPGVALAGACGLFGSYIDSVLGATLQYSGFDTARRVVVNAPNPNATPITGRDLLTNDLVNLLSATITSVAAAYASLYIF